MSVHDPRWKVAAESAHAAAIKDLQELRAAVAEAAKKADAIERSSSYEKAMDALDPDIYSQVNDDFRTVAKRLGQSSIDLREIIETLSDEIG